MGVPFCMGMWGWNWQEQPEDIVNTVLQCLLQRVTQLDIVTDPNQS